MKNPTKKYDKEHLRNLSIYEQQIAKIYESAIQEAAAIGITVGNYNPAKRFKFADYPITTERINKMINKLASNVQTAVVNGIRSEWTLANNKNNELSRVVFGDKIGKLTSDQYRKVFSNNDKALEAFLKRKKAGLNLSKRVWNNSQNFKDEMELALGIGIKEGIPANEIARYIHKYLQNPEALAKDIRKEFGKDEEIKQRIKRSKRSNQNSLSSAKRLARTETNIAYHTADYERWQNMDFVVGIQISLSGNHTVKTPKGVLPLIDICDDLQGKYPKMFKFTGWHPNCRCHATPIMKDPNELFSDEPSKNEIKDVPENFKKWVIENENRAEKWSSMPYFIQDNFIGGKISGGLKNFFDNNFNVEKMLADMKQKYGNKFDIQQESLYKQKFNKFDLEKVVLEIENCFIENGASLTKIEVNSCIIKIEGQYQNQGIEILRYFSFNKSEVNHSRFKLPVEIQGKGISKVVLKSFYEQYKNQGIKKITIHANMDVGGYCWAKYGFQAKKRDVEDLLLQLEDKKEFYKKVKEEIDKFYSTHKKSKLFPMRKIAEIQDAKRALYKTSWFGELNLKYISQMKDFEDFLKNQY